MGARASRTARCASRTSTRSRSTASRSPTPPSWQTLFEKYEAEAKRCLEAGLVLPAYDFTLKCSHAFNILDARGAVSATDRVGVIKRVRDLAVECAKAYVASREALGFPLLPKKAETEPPPAAPAGEPFNV